MPSSVSVRPAVDSDLPSLHALFEALDDLHHTALPQVFRKPDGVRRDLFRPDSIIGGDDRTILVAEGRDKKIVGLVVLIARSIAANVVRDARQFVEIDQLVISVGARRSGVGRSILEASKTWARQRGISQLEVSAWSFNVEAIEFYRKLGFRRTVERFAISTE